MGEDIKKTHFDFQLLRLCEYSGTDAGTDALKAYEQD